MKIQFLAILAFFFFATSLQAQVGNTGAPIADFETELMCWDSSGTNITVVRLSLYIVGSNLAPKVTTYHNLAGENVNPDEADLSWGDCDGNGGGGAVSTNDYELIELCDDGTPFYRLIKVDGSDDSSSSLGDFDTDWASYTVSGTVDVGPCVTSTTVSWSRQVFAQTSGSVVAGKQSVVICNIGIVDEVLTVGAISTKLLPGECWSYTAYFDPVTQTYHRSDAVSWLNASTLSVTFAD